MREIRQSGSEGGAAGVTTGRLYPYRPPAERASAHGASGLSGARVDDARRSRADG